MENEFAAFEEVGGSCRTEYTCDICEEREYHWDEWGVEILGMTRMFRVGDKDICEHCLRRLMEKSADEVLQSLQ